MPRLEGEYLEKLQELAKLLDSRAAFIQRCEELLPDQDPTKILNRVRTYVSQGKLERGERTERKGVEVRNDGEIVINWTTRTIITDLGSEYGTYVCSFSRHSAIQRAYSDAYEGKGENQAEIAMRFDFPATRAVGRYMRIHGIRHSSLPQTDLEFEDGLTPEEAVEDTIQSLKRAAHKKTQQRLWKETQADADKWRDLAESFIEPLREDIRNNLPSYKPEKLELPKTKHEPFIGVVALSDWHFAKYAYGPDGKRTYGKAEALLAMKFAVKDQLNRILQRGTPEKLIVVVGSDNLHIDSEFKTTTRGTPQDVEGEYEVILKPYIDANMWLIETCRQIAPVDVMVVKGNHDKSASMWLGHLLSYRYELDSDVVVIHRTHPRTYVQYGDFCLGFTHGDPEFTSSSKTDRNIHKLFLTEAKAQDVHVQSVEHYYMFAGNLHFEATRDYGVATYLQMPALCGDDRWHKENVYIGARKQSAVYIVERDRGLTDIIYSPI